MQREIPLVAGNLLLCFLLFTKSWPTLALSIWLVAKYAGQQEQTGFVQEKFILDDVVLAWEAMEQANEIGQQCIMLNIDVDKAYDRGDWSFLSKMLT